jgi:hypothetical protein
MPLAEYKPTIPTTDWPHALYGTAIGIGAWFITFMKFRVKAIVWLLSEFNIHASVHRKNILI